MVKVSQFIPMFRSFDESKAIEFYVDYVGFKITFECGSTRTCPRVTAYCEIHLSEHHEDTTPGPTVRIEVNDTRIQVFYDELQTKNYKYAKPELQRQPWGFREVWITDPFGNKLIFVNRTKASMSSEKKDLRYQVCLHLKRD